MFNEKHREGFWSQDEIDEKIIDVLKEDIGLSADLACLDTRLADFIASDDLSYVFIPTLIKFFSVEIPPHEWLSCHTGRDVASLLMKYLASGA